MPKQVGGVSYIDKGRSFIVVQLLFTPCSRVLLWKLTGSQLVKKLLAFHGTRSFITTFTSAHQLSLFWARSIQSMPHYRTSWRFILTLSSYQSLGPPISLFPTYFPIKTLKTLLLSPYVLHSPPLHSHQIRFDFITWIIFGEDYRLLSSSLLIIT
jgi:hypothetical protein